MKVNNKMTSIEKLTLLKEFKHPNLIKEEEEST